MIPRQQNEEQFIDKKMKSISEATKLKAIPWQKNEECFLGNKIKSNSLAKKMKNDS